MGRLTPDKAKFKKDEELLKRIWNQEFDRPKDELTMSMENPVIKIIATTGKEIEIHPQLIDDYNQCNSSEKPIKLERISERLKKLL